MLSCQSQKQANTSPDEIYFVSFKGIKANKNMLRLLILTLILQSAPTPPVEKRVNDGLGNTTRYIRKTDTSYWFINHYEGVKTAQGTIVRPNLNEVVHEYHFRDTLLSVSPPCYKEKNGACVTDTLDVFDDQGQQEMNFVFQQGKVAVMTRFRNGQPCKRNIQFPEKNYWQETTWDNNGKLLHQLTIQNGKYLEETNGSKKTRYDYLPQTGEYVSKKHLLYQNRPSGTHYAQYVYADGRRVAYNQYDNGNGTTETRSEFKQFRIQSSRLVIKNLQGKIISTTLEKYGYDPNGRKQSLEISCNGKRLEHFFVNYADSVIQYSDSTKEIQMAFKGQQIICTEKKNHFPENKRILENLGPGKYHITFWQDQKMTGKRIIELLNFGNIQFPDFQSGDFKPSITNLIYLESYFSEKDSNIWNQVIENSYDPDLSEDGMYHVFNDTLIDPNGNIIGYLMANKNEYSFYSKDEKGRETVYNSRKLRIAKDFETCNLGLKDERDSWFIPPLYTDVREIKYDYKNKYYLCLSGELCSIYDLYGNLMANRIPDLYFTYNSIIHDHYPYTLFVKKPNEVQLILYQNNDSSRLFRLIDAKGNPLFNFSTEPHFLWEEEIIDVDQFRLLGDSAGQTLKALYALDRRMSGFKYESGLMRENFLCLMENKRWKWYNKFLTPLDFPAFDRLEFVSRGLLFCDSSKTFMGILTQTNDSIKLLRGVEHVYSDETGERIVKRSGKLGLCDDRLNMITAFEYDSIYKSKYHYICIKGKRHDVYPQFTRQAIASFDCDEILPGSQGDYDNYENNKLFVLDQKAGLLNYHYQPITRITYDEIWQCDPWYMLINGKDTSYLDASTHTISKQFPANTFLNFGLLYPQSTMAKPISQFEILFDHQQNYTFRSKQLLLNAKGQIIGEDLNFGNSPDRYHYSLISKSGNEPIGLINRKGELKVDFSAFALVDARTGFYYYTDKNGKGGILDNKGRIIIKADYPAIAYDPSNQLLWYCDNKEIFIRMKDRNGHWKIRNARGQIHPETFYSPKTFEGQYCITNNKNNRTGVIDSNMNTLIPFIYEHCRRYPQKYIFERQGESIVTDRNFKTLLTLPCDQLFYLNPQRLLGIHGDTVILLDSNFNTLHLSTKFMADCVDTIQSDGSTIELLNRMNHQWSGHSDEEPEDKEVEATGSLKTMNTALLMHEMGMSERNYHQSQDIAGYPYIYEMYESHPFYPPWGDISSLKVITYSHIPVEYRPNYLQFSQFDFQKESPIAYSQHFITTRNSEGLFSNYYCDSSNGLASVSLYDLIDDNKINAFRNILKKLVKQLDDPDLPCHESDDRIAYFGERFTINNHEILFFEEDHTMHLTLKELAPLLKPFWRKALTL